MAVQKEVSIQKKVKKRELIGEVISNKADKSILIRIERRVKHPSYGKVVTRSSKHAAHDEKNIAKIGDTVRIVESRPMSKTKKWKVVEIINKG